MMEPVHVTGHGRSGTTIAGQLFENLPGFKVWYERSSAALGWVGCPQPPNLARIREWLKSAGGGRIRIVDKDPRHVLRLAPLCEASGGYGIHMARDGRDVACSVQRALAKRGMDHHLWLRKRQADQLVPTGWKLPAHTVKLLGQLPPRVSIGAVWAYIESKARRLHGDSSRVLLVEYADLVMRPEEQGLRIGQHIGMEDPMLLARRAAKLMTDDPKRHTAYFSAGLHDARNRSKRIGRWRDEWTREELLQLDYVCGATYEELGYGCPSAS